MNDEQLTESEIALLEYKIFEGGVCNHEALNRLSAHYQANQEDRDFEKAIELWMAGWTSEPIRPGLRIMSWYWRRPPIGKRPKGRLFLSTDQALNHLRKATPN